LEQQVSEMGGKNTLDAGKDEPKFGLPHKDWLTEVLGVPKIMPDWVLGKPELDLVPNWNGKPVALF